MSDRQSGYQPTPRKRPSARNTRQAQGSARSSERRADASTSNASSFRSRGQASRSQASRNQASRNQASRVASTRARADRTSARTTRTAAPAAAAPAFNRTWLFLIGGIAVVAVIIVALVFSCSGSGQSRDQASTDAAQASQEAATVQSLKNPGPYSVNFTTTGDLIFWREVADFIDANGGAAAMEGIADMLSQADVTISNLESPLSYNDSEPVADKDIYILGRPEAMEGIVNSGIDIVSLANNHIMDYTGPALQDTLNALDSHGILHAGAGMNEADADKIVETEVNGVSIAFFSWTDIVPDYYVAYGDEPGVASARLNMEDALRRVREADETHDIVIVAMHWGIEYQDYVDDYTQVTPAHQLVDAGADVVLGNHPHVPEGIEFYNGALIAYAHGNCVFRQAFEFGNTHQSYVLNFDMTEEGVKNATVTPLYLSDEYGIPSIVTGDQAASQLAHLAEISEGMNIVFDIQGDVAYITPAS